MDPSTIFIGALAVVLGLGALYFRYLWFEERRKAKEQAETFQKLLEEKKNKRMRKSA